MISKENSQPSLNGLVLAGGRSRRMGQDKDLIKWHDKEQRYHVADMLNDYCDEVFISCRPDQESTIDAAYKILPDSFLDMGPLGGILSALRAHRDKAWLVVACDLPLLEPEAIRFLTGHRNAGKMATAYASPYDGMPEPLITIWEPSSYPVLLEFLGRGITCPRKALMNHVINVIQPLHQEALMNVNTPADAETAKAYLVKK